MRDVAFLAAWLALLPLALRHAHVGVMLYAWAAFLSPNDYIYGFMRAVPFSKVVVAATLLAVLFDKRRRRLYLDPTLLLLILLGVVGTISQLEASAIGSEARSWDIWLNFVKSLAFCFLLVWVTSTRLRLQSLLFAVCLGLGFDGIDEGLKVLASGGSHRILGLGTLGDNNQFALAMLMSVPIQFYLYRSTTHPVVKGALLATACLCVVSVFGTQSRGGFIGLVVLALGLLASSRRKVASLTVLVAACVIVYMLAPDSWFSRIGTIETAGDDLSFMGRVVAWKMSLLIALDHPLLGGGFWAVQNQEVWSTYRLLFDQLAFISTPEPDIRAHAAHSIYFEVLGDLGFGGLVLFLGALVSGFANLTAVRKAAKRNESLAWASDLARALQFSLVLYAVSGAALSMAYFELFYLLLAVSSLLRRMVLHELVDDPAARPAAGPIAARASWPVAGTAGLGLQR